MGWPLTTTINPILWEKMANSAIYTLLTYKLPTSKLCGNPDVMEQTVSSWFKFTGSFILRNDTSRIHVHMYTASLHSGVRVYQLL